MTIISGQTNGNRIVDEEQFGPLLPVIRYVSVDEAIELAKASEFGEEGLEEFTSIQVVHK